MTEADGHTPGERVVAVISAFNPSSSIVNACRSVIGQVAAVVVVDDGSADNAQNHFDACRALGCEVERLETNSGIAAALNRGLQRARALPSPPEFVLTLDQDSVLQPDYVRRAFAAFRSARVAGFKVGAVAPYSVEGLPSRIDEQIGDVVLGVEPIQSGLFIPRSVIDEVGPFREELFIDAVDTEFFMRLRDAGFAVVLASETMLAHSLGSRYIPTLFGRPLRLRGRPVSIVRSSTFRYYYIARNRVVLNRLFGARHRRWAVRETLLDLRHMVILLCLVPGRLRHIRLIAAGWKAGMRGQGGRMPPSVERILHR